MKRSRFLWLLFLSLQVLTLALSTVLAISNFSSILAQQETAVEGKFLGMGLSTGLAAIGAGFAVGHTGTAAIASITEKPEIFGRAMIFVGLAEGIAIYGLLISFLIWIS